MIQIEIENETARADTKTDRLPLQENDFDPDSDLDFEKIGRFER
jgi:hypothetical protein